MSSNPYGLAPFGYEPTGIVPPAFQLKFARVASGAASPHGYVRPSSPWHACSHCASVGNAPPTHAAYARACSRVTHTTGCAAYDASPK